MVLPDALQGPTQQQLRQLDLGATALGSGGPLTVVGSELPAPAIVDNCERRRGGVCCAVGSSAFISRAAPARALHACPAPHALTLPARLPPPLCSHAAATDGRTGAAVGHQR